MSIPTQLGKYEVRGILGRGAMGTVYDGWDPAIHRRVAIKTVSLPDVNDAEASEGFDRFKREAQAAGRLTHPNIVGIFDYGETADVAFIVMEFVEGRSLKEMLEGDLRLPVAESLRLMGEVLAGLAYSHGRGVVHRDIKPANIMVTNDVGQAKIADFGIARIEASSMTQAGTVMGTPAYMSPEQFMGQVVDPRTDIYSCGILLYQLLTGERPYEGSMSSIMHKAMTTTPPAPSDLAVTSPRTLDPVVARAMARRPEDRFATAADFAAALRAPVPPTSDATIMAPRIAPAPSPTRKPNRTPIFVAAGVAVAVAAGAAALLLRPSTPVAPLASAELPAITEASPPRQAPPVAATTLPEIAAPPPPAMTQPTQQDAAIVAIPSPAPLPAPPPATPAMASPPIDPASIPCSLIQTTSRGITALAGTQSEAAVQRAADTQPRIVGQAFCTVLDQLRALPNAGPANTLFLGQVGGPAPLLDDQVISVEAIMPAYAGHLNVTYIQADGTIATLVPGAGYPSQTYPARSRVALGTPRPGFAGWQVGPPFGTDLILAIASTAPLFQQPPPENQSLDAYLSALQAAIDALRRRGGNVTATALPIETRPAH